MYKRIWREMQKQPLNPLIDSAEEGVKMVRDKRNVAFIGGRQTFFFDTRRFGIIILILYYLSVTIPCTTHNLA